MVFKLVKDRLVPPGESKIAVGVHTMEIGGQGNWHRVTLDIFLDNAIAEADVESMMRDGIKSLRHGPIRILIDTVTKESA
jgi:hypothetical protein